MKNQHKSPKALCQAQIQDTFYDMVEMEFLEKFDGQRENNRHEVSKDFIKTTSFHGVRYIVKANSMFRRNVMLF